MGLGVAKRDMYIIYIYIYTCMNTLQYTHLLVSTVYIYHIYNLWISHMVGILIDFVIRSFLVVFCLTQEVANCPRRPNSPLLHAIIGSLSDHLTAARWEVDVRGVPSGLGKTLVYH